MLSQAVLIQRRFSFGTRPENPVWEIQGPGAKWGEPVVGHFSTDTVVMRKNAQHPTT